MRFGLKTITALLIPAFLSPSFASAAEGGPRSDDWLWSVQPSLGRYDYSESLGNIKVAANVLSLQAGASRAVGEEDAYELAGTARLSLASFGVSSAGDLPTPPSTPGIHSADVLFSHRSSGQELGIESYRLKLGLGAQIWGMTVPGNDYGVKIVMGPEFLAQAESHESAATPWSAHLKVAPLSEKTITFDLNSYKVGLGGAYRLNQIRGHPLDLTLEIEKISLSLESSVNQIEVLTFGAGLRCGF